MSLQTEIQRVSSAKDAISAAIIAKGGYIETSALIDTYAAAIEALPAGSGSTDFSVVTATPEDVLSGKLYLNSVGALVAGAIASISASTYTPTTSNIVIASGVYIGGDQTISGDTNLTSDNIKSGVSIFGVTGNYAGYNNLYTSTTAEEQDVLYGKRFVNSSGNLKFGRIPAIGANTITPTTTDQFISAGIYLGGAQTIKGDTKLNAANIKVGVSIFGVSGIYTTPVNSVSISGPIGSGAGDWYNYVYGVKYDNYDYSISSCVSFASDFSVTGWMMRTARNTAAVVIGGSHNEPDTGVGVYLASSGLSVSSSGLNVELLYSVPESSWQHFCVQYNDATKEITISINNGATTRQTNVTIPPITSGVPVGINAIPTEPYGRAFGGAYTHVQVWDRLLTSDEKISLYNEWHPEKIEPGESDYHPPVTSTGVYYIYGSSWDNIAQSDVIAAASSLDNMTITSGKSLVISSGGNAANTTIDWSAAYTQADQIASGAYVVVSDGAGLVSATTVEVGGGFLVNGGTVCSTGVGVLGSMFIGGGVVSNLNIQRFGSVFISGGTIEDVTVSGSICVVEEETIPPCSITNLTVGYHGSGAISGGSITGVVLNSGGVLDVKRTSSFSAVTDINDVIVNQGAELRLAGYAMTISGIVENGGAVYLSDVDAIGTNVFFTPTTVQYLYVKDGRTTVHSGTVLDQPLVGLGSVDVHPHGVVSSPNIDSGNVIVGSLGVVTDPYILNGKLLIEQYGYTSNVVLDHTRNNGTLEVSSLGSALDVDWKGPFYGDVIEHPGAYVTYVSGAVEGVYYTTIYDDDIQSASSVGDIQNVRSMFVMANGTANNITLYRGYLAVSSTGIASGVVCSGPCTVKTGPYGGSITNITLNHGTSLGAYGDGVNSITVNKGATLYGDSCSNIIENGGYCEIPSEQSYKPNTIQELILTEGYSATVHGQTKIASCILSGGSLYIYEHGSVGLVDNWNGLLSIWPSGTATVTFNPFVAPSTISSEAYVTFLSPDGYVYCGYPGKLQHKAAVVSDVACSCIEVYSGASAINVEGSSYIKVYGGVVDRCFTGFCNVSAGGVAINPTIYSGGVLNISSDGVVSGTFISTTKINSENSNYISIDIFGGTLCFADFNVYGADITVEDGGKLTDTTVAFGSVYVQNGGVAQNITMAADESHTWPCGLQVGSRGSAVDVVLSGGGLHAVGIDGAVSHVEIRSDELYILGGFAEDLTVSRGRCTVAGAKDYASGEEPRYFPGSAESISILSGGTVQVYYSAVVSNVTVSSGGVLRGRASDVGSYDTGTLIDVTVLSGGALSGGGKIIQSNVVISSGGYVEIGRGDSAIGLDIKEGASATINVSSGAWSSTFIEGFAYGSPFLVESGALDTFTLSSGVDVHVWSSCLLNSGTMCHGATLTVESAGSALDLFWEPGEGYIVSSRGATITYRNTLDGVYVLSRSEDSPHDTLLYKTSIYSEPTLAYPLYAEVYESGVITTTIWGQGSAVVKNGGSVSAVSVNNGGYIYAEAGAVLERITENGGYVDVTGATDYSFTGNIIRNRRLTYPATVHGPTKMSAGVADELYVYSGGKVYFTSVTDLTVYSSGYADHPNIYRSAVVYPDGILQSPVVTSAQSGVHIRISSGGSMTDFSTVDAGAPVSVVMYGYVSGCVLTGSQTVAVCDRNANISAVTVRNIASLSCYGSASVTDITADSKGTVVVSGTTPTLSSITLSSGGSCYLYVMESSVQSSDSAIESDGSSGMVSSAVGVHVSGAVFINSYEGGVVDTLEMHTSDTVISADASAILIRSASIYPGATMVLTNGASADGVFVSSGGILEMNSGGTATNVTVCRGTVVSDGVDITDQFPTCGYFVYTDVLTPTGSFTMADGSTTILADFAGMPEARYKAMPNGSTVEFVTSNPTAAIFDGTGMYSCEIPVEAGEIVSYDNNIIYFSVSGTGSGSAVLDIDDPSMSEEDKIYYYDFSVSGTAYIIT